MAALYFFYGNLKAESQLSNKSLGHLAFFRFKFSLNSKYHEMNKKSNITDITITIFGENKFEYYGRVH